MSKNGPRVTQSDSVQGLQALVNLPEPPPMSLMTVVSDVVLNGLSATFGTLINGIKSEIAKHNSMRPIISWMRYLNPNTPQLDLATIPPLATAAIENAKVSFPAMLSDKVLVDAAVESINTGHAKLVEMAEEAEPIRSISQVLGLLPPYLQVFIPAVLSKMASANAALSVQIFQLANTIVATPEVDAILRSVNPEEVVAAIETDEAALQGLDRIAKAITKLLKTLMNDPALVKRGIDIANAGREYQQLTLGSFTSEARRNLSKVSGEFLMDQMHKTNINAFFRLQPLKTLLIDFHSEFLKSELHKAICNDPRLCAFIDSELKLAVGTPYYEAHKAFSPEVGAAMRRFELDVAAGALRPVVVQPVVEQSVAAAALGASAPKRRSAILMNFREITSDAKSSDNEEEKTVTTKRRKKR